MREIRSNSVLTIGALETDYDSVLGLCLSLFESRTISRFHVGRRFNLQNLLLQRFTELKSSECVLKNGRLMEAFESLEQGILEIMGKGTKNGQVPAHEHFFNGAEVAKGITSSLMADDEIYLDDEKNLNFDTFLLAVKILVIGMYFRDLESEFGIIRDYDEEVCMSPPLIVAEILMSSGYVTTASLKLTKSRTMSLSAGKFSKTLRRASTFSVATTEPALGSLPPLASHIMAKCLAVDRIVTRYCDHANEAGKFVNVFNMRAFPAVYQKQIKNKSDTVPGTLLVLEDSWNNLVSNIPSKSFEVYSSSSERCVAEIKIGNEEEITATASNASYCALGMSNGIIRIVSSIDGQDIATVKHDDKAPVTAIVIDTFSNRMFSAAGGAIVEWNTDTWVAKAKVNKTLPAATCLITDERPTTDAYYSAKILISGHQDGSIIVWNIMTDKISFMYKFDAHAREVLAVAIREGLILTAGGDKRMKLWDMSTRNCVNTWKMDGKVSNIVVDYDVYFVSVGSTLMAYDKSNFGRVLKIKLDSNINALALNRDRRLFSVEDDRRSPVRKWDVEGLLDTVSVQARLGGTLVESSQYSSYFSEKELEGMDIKYVLDNPKHRHRFMGYLRDEKYADENLLFWVAATRYRKLSTSSDGTEEMKEMLNQFGAEIIQEYIKPGAARELNLSSQERNSLTNLRSKDLKADTFDSAIQAVEDLMGTNFLFPFTKSLRNPLLEQSSRKSGRIEV